MSELLQLLVSSKADYTRVFRLLCAIPEHSSDLHAGFYLPCSEEIDGQWRLWLQRWRALITAGNAPDETSAAMRRVNPAITWREWLIAPAYQQAERGDNSLIQELQALFSNPYDTPANDLAARYDQLRPQEFFRAGGISHYSCSS